jgi:hypothetical protein
VFGEGLAHTRFEGESQICGEKREAKGKKKDLNLARACRARKSAIPRVCKPPLAMPSLTRDVWLCKARMQQYLLAVGALGHEGATALLGAFRRG